MQERPILVLDEGTTSTRAILYSADGKILGVSQSELTQHYPAPGYVEHDANEIWEKTLACAQEMVARAGGADRIAAIGITNQRETVVAWDRQSGNPVTRAIVWQDRRTADRCQELREAGHEKMIGARTGLMLDPYFSATKMSWILEHVPAARELGDRLAFGTVESWLVWKLTRGLHITDASNASRTMLMPLEGVGWDDELLALHGISRASLPEIVDNAGEFERTSPELFGGSIAICGLAGDQQAATIGQNCLSPGDVKATLGTGAFVLANTGTTPRLSSHRLVSTVLAQIGGQRSFALEGSVFVAGSLVKWLRDELCMVGTACETESLARSIADSGGVCILPALSGLGAPHWRAEARGVIAGLTHGTGRAHIVRAALEAMAHQMHDLKVAFDGDGAAWLNLRLDGGMSANDWIAQDLADILDLQVERPLDVETTALGAAMLASVGCGIYGGLEEAARMRPEVTVFRPAMKSEMRRTRLGLWHDVLSSELGKGV
ncbi:glycerol kinase [Novosphingobium sp. KN65.2]|uniref:glycerol kinase n=1 Tax=Novosphingobium sp. KN65.2 TaxID=1478134 RepID=UPI0005E9F061|nr:glycerol kinase [Novosphingobium sp. KN65.2]CDO35406.1 Glycerol kinase [Novosphingobium sp. KN65.2]